MLNRRNIRTRWSVKKLDTKLFGPFKVVRLVGQRGQSVEFEFPQRWRVHNVFHTSLIEPYRTSVCGLRDEPIAVTDTGYVDRRGVTHEVGYDVEGNQVLEDFKVEEIMESHYNAEWKKVLYLIKWKGYLEESKWTEEPLEHLPHALVRTFPARCNGGPIDGRRYQETIAQ